ncbi:MAG: hypothetical protein IAE98_03180 [Candidatus Kapabacteria bacterium]|nr:hypothetical protein [Candidatus Kapabacteria bacterium]
MVNLSQSDITVQEFCLLRGQLLIRGEHYFIKVLPMPTKHGKKEKYRVVVLTKQGIAAVHGYRYGRSVLWN